MCYKDEDEELWQEDPYEYIRMKFGNLALFFAFIVTARCSSSDQHGHCNVSLHHQWAEL